MVAITVILAAVIAAFVFGMGPPAKAPQASLRLELNGTSIDLRHQGGDTIVWSAVTVTATGVTSFATPSTGNLTAGGVYSGIANGTVGTEVRINIVDKASQQMIMDARIRP